MKFFRYPHTPHLAWLATGRPRDDKVLPVAERSGFLATELVVEEKLDGANLGFSIGDDGTLLAQNRGNYLSPPFTGQFARLNDWLSIHRDKLFDALSESLIVFGEWCASRHSLDYDRLPDWWIMFDVYEPSEGRFWSTRRRGQLARAAGVEEVPCLNRGTFSLKQLHDLVMGQDSSFRKGPLEGVILRREDSSWLRQSAKLVRPGFTQNIEQHWRSRPLAWNQLRLPSSE